MNGFEVHKSMKNFEQSCDRLERDELVCPENKKLILSFSKMRLAKGSSRLRVVKCMYGLRFLSHWLKKPFEQATKNDLIELVGEIERQDYSENSKYDFKVILKMFYKWLKGNDETFPPEISWLKPKLNNHAHKLPEELLTQDEVLKMTEAADNPRDKALILVLYETGCRIGEMLSLRMKNVIFDQYGAILRVTGKTGDRRVRIISSAPVLASWIEVYAHAKDPEAPLWPPLATNHKNRNQPAEHSSINIMIKRLAKKAGIKKRVYAHLFRHSRATFLAEKLTEAQMKEYFGWVQSSEMAATYVHLSGRDVDNALLALQGLAKPEDKKEEQIKVCFCPRCREKNSPIAKFCLRCGTPNQALETKLADTKRLYDSLYKGEEKIFRVSLYVDNKENTEEKLNFLTEKCKSNLNSLLIIPKTCNYRMAEGIKSCLPLCQDELKVQQEFSTNSLAATIPFISTSSGRKNGVLFAKEEETKNPVFIDFESLPNKHFFVIGTSGSGKSYTAKYLLIQLFIALDARIYVLDPNAEYRDLCTRFGGQNIEISRTSDSVINVFDLANEDYGSKMLSLISVFDLIVGGLSESQKGVLNRLLIQTYELKGITQGDVSSWNNEPPTFSDFFNVVQKVRSDALGSDKLQNKQETKSLEVLANRTSMYVKGGFFGFLDQETKIDIKQRFINFDLSQLPGAVKPLMMFAVLDFIIREIKKDNKPKVLLIDEGWTLLRSREAENYLLDFIKTSRKYGASIGFITQEIEDLLASESGKSILNQTSTKILMRQNTTNIDLISNFLKLNNSEKDFLIKCQKGHGLLIAGDEHTRFFTKPPKAIHEMITTDPAEVLEIKRKEALGQVAQAKKELREAKPLSPEEEVKWDEKRKASLDVNKDYYKVSELNENQIKVLKRMGYQEVQFEPFGKGVGPLWLVLTHGKESPKHVMMVRATRDEILKYCNDVILNDTVEPDVVAVHKGKKIAFEIETGSWVETRKPELEQRFSRLRAKYPDGYYIIVTNAAYESDYQPFGTVITKNKLQESIKAIFS